MTFLCTRCGFNTEKKQTIKRHIENRKKLCPSSLKDVNPEIREISPLMCSFCGNEFSEKYSVKRHQKTCKHNKLPENTLTTTVPNEGATKEELLEIIQQLIKNPNVVDNSIDNSVNNDNSVANTINITILAYPDSDFSHLTDDKIREYLVGDPVQNIPKLIEYIHCNPEKPENHNIFINNKVGNDISVWNGTGVDIMKKDKIIQGVIDKSSDHFEKMANINHKPQYEKYVVRRKANMYDDDNNIENNIENEVKKSLNKHKTMIKNTIKKAQQKNKNSNK